MVRKALSIFCFIFLFSASSFAQLYPTQHRPPNQNWQQLKTPHFKFIYAQENESQAFELAQILETQYPKVQDIVGGELNNFPIILNNYNDRSNGFVTSFNFRSEIELPPIKGKSLNPQTGNWLASVGPHELVHALHFSNLGDYNIPQLVSLFSPDLARSIHGALPPGIIEGIAVHHETTNITDHGGRGNYPIFTKQFDATFDSKRRWTMKQLIQPPDYTRPFGRHYIGGYEFTDWLHNTFGVQVTRDTFDFFMDFPFLGYGFALRHVTGSWPGQLYNQFKDHHKNQINENQSGSRFLELDLPYKGAEIRRPQWLSDSELIFYGSFYNARSGFYIYDLANKKMRRLITTNSVGDFRYDLSADRSQMIFSYYETNPLYDNTAKTELVQYNFNTHQKKQLTKNGRLYAPAFYGDKLLALKSHPARSKLVTLDNFDYSDEREVFSAPNHEIKAVTVHPERGQLAIVSNKNGQQALWITERDEIPGQLKGEPDVAFEKGSVFDPEWHPKEDNILFSSDFSGTMQLYEYDLSEQEILQVTDSKFNAFEGSYSPDGNRIAFIRQEENKRLPDVLERTAFLNKPVKKTLWQTPLPQGAIGFADLISDSVSQASSNWQMDSYSSGLGWLKPRTILPFADEVSNQNDYQVGVSLHSVNTLSSQAYSADVSYFKDRGWYDITYQNKTFWPGFKLRTFNAPSYRSAPGVGILGRQEQSLASSIPFRINFNQNVYSTSLYIEPEFRRSRVRFFDPDFHNPLSDFANISAANIYAQFNYRLQQNIRDVQPNTGLILFSEVERYLSGDEITFSIPNGNLSLTSPEATAVRGGIYGYIAPFKRLNQSLRLGVRGIYQSDPIFDTQSIVSEAFSGSFLGWADHLVSFNTRYIIPLFYVDDGGLLLPLYLSNIYLVGFTDTVFNPTRTDWINRGSSVFGVGIRTRFRLSNMSLDIGVGFGYEPSGESRFFIGDF